ncbi:MAG: CPBP family intramembrane glutamic endopeptidase [Candidatus Hydrogenedentota bacterium]
MKAAFIVILLGHVTYSVLTKRPDPYTAGGRNGIVVLYQTVLFCLALALAYQYNALSRTLLSPVYIAAGIAAGHAIFAVTIILIYGSFEDAWAVARDVKGLYAFIKQHPYVLANFFYIALSEEFIYRAVAQRIFVEYGGRWLGEEAGVYTGIVALAVAFSAVHKHFFKKSLLVSGEFLGFALLLGFAYHWTNSLAFVILIHALRDIEICFLEFLVKRDEYGDAAKADAEIEAAYGPRARRSHGPQISG